ncbi:hypothetical protein LJ756_13490 [Arthrobacter sp. zg-Y411]|uniref:hypothetical protein n=1 Tax=Arthrobacter zhangbolii TaxID=2886936 RepID=UPI001D15563C|nr:hypothetical protein [Arthrobacter zhangbolii]MCC3295631.1 hypothetical protein [Arthrobacter zhangbolii]
MTGADAADFAAVAEGVRDGAGSAASGLTLQPETAAAERTKADSIKTVVLVELFSIRKAISP